MNKNIKLVATDIDGVWTDAKMHYTENGDFMKSFSTYDGMGVEMLRNKNIETVIMTSENSNIVLRRAEKLKIKEVYIDEKNKLERLKKICSNKKITLNEVAYIGDDINDLKIMKLVGFRGCPSDAQKEIKLISEVKCKKEGGKGVFREFANTILENL